MKKPLQYSILSVCTYCGSGFILLMCVHKQNRLDLRPLFLMSEVLKAVFAAVYRVMLLMSEVSKVAQNK